MHRSIKLLTGSVHEVCVSQPQESFECRFGSFPEIPHYAYANILKFETRLQIWKCETTPVASILDEEEYSRYRKSAGMEGYRESSGACQHSYFRLELE